MRRAATKKAPRQLRRLSPEDRRRQLLGVAARLLTEQGATRLQFTELATAAGVSRPVIYRFFPTRQALLSAVLDDFVTELSRRFFEAAARSRMGSLDKITAAFVNAVCDTIEDKGAGAWHLLGSGGADAEAAQLGRAALDRIVEPWLPAIAERTHAQPRQVRNLSVMLVAAGRAVLELWYAGSLSRHEAELDATRGVSALLKAFTRAK